MSRVGQFFGKLFSGTPGRNDVVLRAYGKLPYYAEYRRLEVSPGAPTIFSRWLDEGRLAWVRAKPEGQRGTMRTSRVVLRWPESREWVVGTIWDSRDNLGRLFPFVFFVTCTPESLGDTLAQRWAACLALHEQFDQLHARLATLGGGGDFYHLFSKQTLPAQPEDLAQRTEELHERARQITLPEWFSASGLSGVQAGDWFTSLRRRAERWQTQSSSAGKLALSFPLTGRVGYAVQAALWLEWMAAMRRDAEKQVCVIVPAIGAAGPARMQVLLRDLLPDDFQLLTTDAGAYGYVEDLGQPPAPAAGDPPVAASSEQEPAATATAVPVGSMLEALTRRGT